MKKLIACLLFVSFLLVLNLAIAENGELEGAIIRLYSAGPDAQIEETLKSFSENPDQAVAARAKFHLSCLQILQGGENAAKALADLEQSARTDSEKETIGILKELMQKKASLIPEEFQEKISLDFKNTEIKAVVAIIAKSANANIVVHNKITDKVSISLKNATVLQAIETLCTIADLRYENNDGIFILLPPTSRRENYEKREIRLAFLSPEEALKMATSDINTSGSGKAPAAMSTGKTDSRPTEAEAREVTFKTTADSIIMEGKLAALEKYENFLRNLDRKGKAQKISFRIWKTQPGKQVALQDFLAMNDAKKNETATIISAPVLITLPGKEAKIEVGERNGDGEKSIGKPMFYSMSCIIHETGNPDLLRLIGKIKVSGSNVADGKTVEFKKEYAPTLEISRNKWVMLPIYEGQESLFLELQVSSHVE